MWPDRPLPPFQGNRYTLPVRSDIANAGRRWLMRAWTVEPRGDQDDDRCGNCHGG
jgi:hypothetical protein